jgi:hypothetical protein
MKSLDPTCHDWIMEMLYGELELELFIRLQSCPSRATESQWYGKTLYNTSMYMYMQKWTVGDSIGDEITVRYMYTRLA